MRHHLLRKLRRKRCDGTVHEIVSPSKSVEVELCDGCAAWSITAHGDRLAEGQSLAALHDQIPTVVDGMREQGYAVAAYELDHLFGSWREVMAERNLDDRQALASNPAREGMRHRWLDFRRWLSRRARRVGLWISEGIWPHA